MRSPHSSHSATRRRSSRRIKNEAQRTVDDYSKRANEANLRANGLVIEGEPVAVVLQAADDFDADLIILSTHGRGGLARLWMGSVAEGIIRKSRLPVLIAPTGLSTDRTDRYLHPILAESRE